MNDTAIIDRLAQFVSDYEFKPDQRLNQVIRDSVLDTFGCMLVGAQQEVSRMCREARLQTGKGDSPIYGTESTASPENAAFLNAVSAHVLDLDDWEIPGNSHASAVMVPALLAAAEQQLTIEQISSAYVVGFEVIARLGEAINFEHYNRGWHTTGTLACIGSSAAISKLWGLSAEKTAHAISLSVSRAGGLFRQFGSHAKPLQAGFAAENALSAARLARAGLTGQARVLEGEQGYFALTGHNDVARQQAAFANLGQPLALLQYGQVLKRYAGCGYTHRILDCAIQSSVDRNRIEDIRSVTIEVPDFHAAILPFIQPQNQREAMFSLPFAAAMGLIHRDLNLSDYQAERWNDADIKRLISKSVVKPFIPARPELNYDAEQPDRLTISFKNGERIEVTQDYPLGAPQNPMDLKTLMSKFMLNAQSFSPPVTDILNRLTRWQADQDLLPLLQSLGARK